MSGPIDRWRRTSCGLTLLLASCGATPTVRAQSAPSAPPARQEWFQSYDEFKSRLTAISQATDAANRQAQLDELWTNLKAAGQVPYAQGDRVAFLYRGEADSVSWVGDFNGWKPDASGWSGVRLAETDLWILEKSFPADARLDYKIVVDDSEWKLDPANPLQAWSGFGPNSELRMPAYKFPPETVRRPAAPRGKLSDPFTIDSANLGYEVRYRVYTPAGYDEQQLDVLAAAYVADGHEYAADPLGAMVVVLDNAIADQSLKPMLAVFIDPRDAKSGANRRHEQYVQNEKFAAFVADELVPAIDAAYRTRQTPDARLILGTSLGGLAAAHLGATRPDVFGKVGVQSPADFARFAPATLKLYAAEPLRGKLKLYVTAGTIGDGRGGVELANVLEANRYDYKFRQVNEGHSWGAWRGQLKSMLIELFSPAATR